MANANFQPMNTRGKARISINGSFVPNGASTSVTGIKGVGFTVVHGAGANTYTVTLFDTFNDYDAIQLQIQSSTLGLQVQVLGEATFATTKQFVIGLLDSSTKAAVNDQAATGNTRIHFSVFLKNTSLGANY